MPIYEQIAKAKEAQVENILRANQSQLWKDHARRLTTAWRHGRLYSNLYHPHFVAQLVHQLLRNIGRRAIQELGLLRLLRHVEALDLLQVFAEGRAFISSKLTFLMGLFLACLMPISVAYRSLLMPD